MALTTEQIVGIVLAILIVVIIVVVIMVLISNAVRAANDSNDSDKSDSLLPIVRPCFKPCGCHCQRACNCHERHHHQNHSDKSSSDSSSSDCQVVKPKKQHHRKESSCSSSSSSSDRYSCTPSESSPSSSSSVSISSESISDDTSLSSISFDRKPCPVSDTSSSSSSSFSPFKAKVVPDSHSKSCHASNQIVNAGQRWLMKPEAPKLNCLTLKDSKFAATCGRADQESFIQWYPEAAVDKYTVYVKAGKNTVTPAVYDFKYDVEPKHNHFLAPKLGSGPFSFVVTASRSNADSTQVESEPSEVFNLL